METVLSTTTVLLSNDYVESFSSENLLCKLRKVRKEIGIKFKKIKKTFALFGTYDMIQEAFELLKLWFERPELEPEGDGTIGEFEQVEMLKNEISWSNAQEHPGVHRRLVGDLEEHLINVDRIKQEIEKDHLSLRKVEEEDGKNFSQEPSDQKAEDDNSLEEEKDTNENNSAVTLTVEAAGFPRNRLKARQSQLKAIKFMKTILKQDKEDTPRTRSATQKQMNNSKISVNISWQKVKKTKKQKPSTDEIPCNMCNVVVRSRRRLNEHIKRMHLKQFKCNLCNKGFGYPTDLHRHKCHGKPEFNQDGSVKQPSKKPKQPSLFPCKDCTYIATAKKRFNEHVKRKHMLTYKCDKCNKSFGIVKDLERHIENVHADPTHFCDKCSRFYRSKGLYESHMKTHEDGYVKPNFTCQICLRSFTTKYVMATHIKKDHLGLKKTWLCSLCGKKFSQMNSYKMHMNAHRGIKPYICDLCGKAFTYNKSLKEHKYMHDTVRRFQCKICSKLFRQKTTLHIHMKIHSTSNDHVCKTCGRGFKQKQALERHERIHTGVRPYTCVLCQQTFGDSSTIRRHMLAIHKKSSDNWRDDTITLAKPKSDYYIEGGTGHNRSYTKKTSAIKKNPSTNKTEMGSKDIETRPVEMYTEMMSKKDQTVQGIYYTCSKELDSHSHNQLGVEFIAEPYHGPLMSMQNAIHQREHSHHLQDGYVKDIQYNSFSCEQTGEVLSEHRSSNEQHGTCNHNDSPTYDAHVHVSRMNSNIPDHASPQNLLHYTQDDFHNLIQEKQLSQNAVYLPVLTPLTSVIGISASESQQPLTQNTKDAVLNQGVPSMWSSSGHPAYMTSATFATFRNHQT